MKKILLGLIGLLFAIPVFAACPTGQIEQTYTSATGTVTQNGTPTPTNPIEPVFYKQGDMILRAVGNVADSYDATTGKITRRIGVKVFDGTESLTMFNYDVYIKPDASNVAFLLASNRTAANNGISNHLEYTRDSIWHKTGLPNKWTLNSGTQLHMNFANDVLGITDYTQETQNSVMVKAKAYLKSQFEAGTPYAFYYVLATPFEEDWNETTYCAPDIKIATTAYNSARFSPVVTELNDTIATIRSVVTNTINQTKAIADLQATKQTRPDETCPAGKKCLLVEDDAGMPHWYEIIESASRLPDGFTELEYIESTGTQYINTGVSTNDITKTEAIAQFTNLRSNTFLFAKTTGTSRYGWGEYIYQSGANKFLWNYGGWSVVTNADLNKHTFGIDTKNSLVYIDNTQFNTSQTSSGGANPAFVPDTWPIYLFARNNSGVSGLAYAKIYSVKMWNDNELTHEFVPAKRDSDGVLGMYDAISGTFFTNAGTGTFIAGQEI